jgi:hypothetical protein
MTLRPLAIPDELRLRPCPALGIDERRAPDRNPFGLRASHTALAVARVAIFQPAPPIGPPDVPRLRAIIVGFPFVEGVAEDLNHTTLGPLTPFGLPGGNAVGGETLMHGIGTQLLLDTPTIDLPYNLRFGLIDHEMLRSSCRLMDIGIPIGRIPPVDPPLAGGKELPASGAFVDQSALVLRKDPLHLEEHLFCGARAQALMHEDDLTPTSGQLFDQYDLIGIAAGEAVRGRDQHDLKGAFGREIA